MTRPPVLRLYADEIAVDLFAGGGGASTGIAAVLGRSPDLAINHDADALAMHRANHPRTRHLQEDVYDVDPRRALRALGARRCGLAWFSPDCTFHSKARGGKPFRDPSRARRIRGLIGIVPRWAAAVRPRIIGIENVEELEDWGPLTPDGRPDPDRIGESYQRWVSRMRNLGYAVEWRQLRAHEYGAPTSRRRLVILCRADGQPIVWPAATHGVGADLAPVRTAAECLDFTQPVPSIFLTPRQARAWGQAHGVPAPRRPLAPATLRRIARGVQRFVLETGDPFIVPVTHAVDGKGRADTRGYPIADPLRTITASPRGEYALVVPALINTRNGERAGQAPRVHDIRAPFPTVTAQGSQGALVAAFLAKHNAGHEATGQRAAAPLDAVTCRDTKALVTSHLVKLRGGAYDRNSNHDVRAPLDTIVASAVHFAEVRTFLLKWYGTKRDGCVLSNPIDVITTKSRFALVTVSIAGQEYVVVDIGMRMLTPRELFTCQGFPADYRIAEGEGADGAPRRFTKQTQTRLVGNSVPPQLAAAVIGANLQEID